jgi:hypothetical protein
MVAIVMAVIQCITGVIICMAVMLTVDTLMAAIFRAIIWMAAMKMVA